MIAPSPYRFLFDECLSADLVALAVSFGHEATHIKFRGRLGASDYELAKLAIETDAVFVTNNARDFKRIYRGLALHPGLLVVLPNVWVEAQRVLMEAAIRALATMSDCINLLIEIDIHENITVTDWSSDSRNEA